MPSDTSLNLPYLIVSIAVISAVLFAILVNTPQVQGILDNRTQADQLDQDIAGVSLEISQIDEKLAQFNQLKTYEDQMDIVLPVDDQEADILHILDSAASNTGITLSKVNNHTTNYRQKQRAEDKRSISTGLPDGITFVTYSLELHGGYDQIRSFIAEIEKSPRLAEINSVSLSRDEQNSDQLYAAMNLYLYTFDSSLHAS